LVLQENGLKLQKKCSNRLFTSLTTFMLTSLNALFIHGKIKVHGTDGTGSDSGGCVMIDSSCLGCSGYKKGSSGFQDGVSGVGGNGGTTAAEPVEAAAGAAPETTAMSARAALEVAASEAAEAPEAAATTAGEAPKAEAVASEVAVTVAEAVALAEEFK
jgi:hypothetical protein